MSAATDVDAPAAKFPRLIGRRNRSPLLQSRQTEPALASGEGPRSQADTGRHRRQGVAVSGADEGRVFDTLLFIFLANVSGEGREGAPPEQKALTYLVGPQREGLFLFCLPLLSFYLPLLLPLPPALPPPPSFLCGRGLGEAMGGGGGSSLNQWPHLSLSVLLLWFLTFASASSMGT